jgi:hypothetical protein
MIKKFIIPFIVLILSFSCEDLFDHAYFFQVQNNSSNKIRCYASYNFPDTSLNLTKPPLHLIEPNSYTKIDSRKEWDKVLPKDTIEIFIFSEDTLLKYDWDIVRKEYKILKRFDLNINEIGKSSNTVIYP